MGERKFVSPVRPVGMELVMFYPCPYCQRNVPLLAPTEPAMGDCDSCGRQFPVVPIDNTTTQYIKLILNNGQAAIDPEYV
ncbi:hypothetical protein [Desulfonatronovibrio magnus]|uniref:hypothetical protein n=1 Tax=Desulfonatronovibrio magnus TaxID=698827 RepID=UPI0005EBCFCA|nr:hypothetical protein [Desulfonatronovibrio magnus]